jgi:hypothetical protein
LPGIVAASLGARVVQTDRQEVALAVCRRNGVLNGAGAVEYRLADWGAWDEGGRYELGDKGAEAIFDQNLANRRRQRRSRPRNRT